MTVSQTISEMGFYLGPGSYAKYEKLAAVLSDEEAESPNAVLAATERLGFKLKRPSAGDRLKSMLT